jgi:hypothetical protein
MSTLNEWNYLKLGAETAAAEPLSCERGEGHKRCGSSYFRQVCRKIRLFISTLRRFLGDLLRGDPASYNERIRKTPYDYIDVRRDL